MRSLRYARARPHLQLPESWGEGGGGEGAVTFDLPGATPGSTSGPGWSGVEEVEVDVCCDRSYWNASSAHNRHPGVPGGGAQEAAGAFALSRCSVRRRNTKVLTLKRCRRIVALSRWTP